MKTRHTLLALLALAAAGCASPFGPGYDYAHVHVTITYATGEPADSVAVQVSDPFKVLAFGTTDATGRIDFDYVPQGKAEVTLDPPAGYRPATFHDAANQHYYLGRFDVPKGGRFDVPVQLVKR
jgi:hypothetical protein